MKSKGHKVETWSPTAWFTLLPVPKRLQKWMGYLDQYLIFPIIVLYKSNRCSRDTLFVFTDNAQGPWVPLVSKKKHVVHCHDFLALQSALGTIPENKTSWTGRKYQRFIKRGAAQFTIDRKNF